MKISEFSKKYDVPVDTIRYYIDSSLLTPQKVHNRYVFDDITEDQMKQILELKDLKFTISEISKILSIERINQIMTKSKRDYFEKFFKEKYNELIIEKDKIEKAMSILHNKLEDLKEIEIKNETKYGFPIKYINLIACPKCGNNLSLNADKIENNQIFTGELTCECGYYAEIDDGILVLDGADKNSKHEDLEKEIEDFYNKDSTPKFTSAFYRSLEWINKNIKKDLTEEKIILEISTASGFIPYFFKNNDVKNIYIINQKYLAFTKFLKNNLAIQNVDLSKVIFTTGNMGQLPLKNDLVDIVVDIFATSNTLGGVKDIPAKTIKKYLKSDALFFSLDVYFEDYAKSLKNFEKEERKFFTLKSKDELYKKAGYEKVSSNIIDVLTETGAHATVHITGENFYIFTQIQKCIKEM